MFSMPTFQRERRCTMDAQGLKKFLAGLGIAGLLAGTSLMAGGCSSA
jgi:radical SAM modification target selenobiotic family peptide